MDNVEASILSKKDCILSPSAVVSLIADTVAVFCAEVFKIITPLAGAPVIAVEKV